MKSKRVTNAYMFMIFFLVITLKVKKNMQVGITINVMNQNIVKI